MKGLLSKPTRTVKVLFLLAILLLLLGLVPLAAYGQTTPPAEDEGSLIENLLALPVNGLYKALQVLGLKTFDELIFNNSCGELAPYTPDEWNVVMAWYQGVRNAVWVMLVIAVAVLGYRIKKNSYSPDRKFSFLNSLESIIYAFAIVLFMPYIVRLIFQFNNGLVSLFKGIAGSMGVIGGEFNLDEIKTGSVLATAIVKLGYLGLLVYFNFLYLIRKFVLTSMLVITPVVAWTWTISGRKEGIAIVLGEIASNAFMQAAHALVLALYLTLLAAGISSDFSPWWAQIFGMICLVPTANVIRNLLQGWLQKLRVNEESWAGAAAMGFAGLAGMARTMVVVRPQAGTILGGSIGGGNQGGGKNGGTGGPVSGVPPLTNAVNTGLRAGGMAGKIGGMAGMALGTALSLPLRTTGIDFSYAGGQLGGLAGTMLGRPAGTGYTLIRQGQEEAKHSSVNLLSGIGKVVGVERVGSLSDGAEVLGRTAGTVLGSAAGGTGARAGQKMGGALGRYGVQMAGIMLATNPDHFRWN